MSHGFNDSFKSKLVAPDGSHDGATDFDWETVYEELGEQVEEATKDLTPIECTRLSLSLNRLLTWLVSDIKAMDGRGVKAVGIKTLAMAQVINPELFGEVSGLMICASLGLHKTKFSERSAEFSRRFSVTNQFKVHDWREKQ